MSVQTDQLIAALRTDNRELRAVLESLQVDINAAIAAITTEDNVTPGLVEALKVLKPDANKDLAALRNLTLEGLLTAANITIPAGGALIGPNIYLTPEGGEANLLINRTGAPSVKGQVVQFSPSYDDSYVALTDPFSPVGFVYNAGVADGQPVWVVRNGDVDGLLQDGFGAIRNGWVRASVSVPGRIMVQSAPGYDRVPSSVAYTAGSLVSGALTDLMLDNDAKMVFAEVVGTPGFDATFTFNVDEPLDTLNLSGYYANNHASGVKFAAWNYSTVGWGADLVTFPANGTQDVAYSSATLTADNYNAGEMKIRMYHPDAGVGTHRIYLDKFVLSSSAAVEHFRECGHTKRAAAAGTDVLVRLNIHFL